MAVVITDRLTIGQLTFILRVLLQAITYGGTFVIGLVVLCYTPTVAIRKTHDLINRRAGKSTATTASLRWIKGRILGKGQNNDFTSKLLVLTISLSLLYALFATISDIGFIGLELCDVPGGTTMDFPGSIRSLEDAESAMKSRFTQGTTPDEAMSHLCDASEDVVAHLPGLDFPFRNCTKWRNSTFADPSEFRQLNLTDTDVLMPRLMSSPLKATNGHFDLNTYFTGGTGGLLSRGTVRDGLAIIPHSTGVTTIVGVPNLPPFSRVTIPKTMASEMSVGCLPVGIFGNSSRTSGKIITFDYFTVDAAYSITRDSEYAGPPNLLPILSKYADQIRQYSMPAFNSSNQVGPNVIQSFNESDTILQWQTAAADWFIPLSGTDGVTLSMNITKNCTAEIHAAVNALAPPPLTVNGLSFGPNACALYQALGSQIVDSVITQQYDNYICGSTTQINMVSATISVDGEGNVTYNITNLPSDLQEISANYDDLDNSLKSGTVDGPVPYSPIVRYTLSDNPHGQTEHYVVQIDDGQALSPFALSQGTGSLGETFRRVGGGLMDVSLAVGLSSSLWVINETHFSYQRSATILTAWMGALGASSLQATLALNPWAALDKPAFQVQSTGGKAAVCYKPEYAVGFAPLVLTAVFIIAWAVVLVFSGGTWKDVKRKERMYGGLAPSVVAPGLVKPKMNDVLAWQGGPHPHLAVVPSSSAPAVGGESEYLLDQM